VLRRGTERGLHAIMDLGGQSDPISMVGARDEWKKAQKNETKNRISDVINSSIPIFILLWMLFEWMP
jgi:hypothetical protein